MKYLIVTIVFAFASNVFAADGLNDAFQAALANSEQDHQKQQVAFDVSPDQVEKATFKRVKEPHIVDVPANISTDMPTILKEKSEPRPEVQPEQPNPSDDLAAANKDLPSDIH